MLYKTELQTTFLYYYALGTLKNLSPTKAVDPQFDRTGEDITINEANGAVFIQYGGYMANKMEEYGGHFSNKRNIRTKNANGMCI